MFFKMLKSDLKNNKGLNVILFIFMIASAAFVFIGAAQVYANFTQNDRTTEVCEMPDVLAMMDCNSYHEKEILEKYDKAFQKSGIVSEYSVNKYISMPIAYFDFKDYDEKEDTMLFDYTCYLTTRPTKKNFIFDVDDNPVYPENGTIAVPVCFKSIIDAKIGDPVRITTNMGNIYEFTISSFIKEPLSDDSWFCRFLISEADYEVLEKENKIESYGFDIMFKERTDGGDVFDSINDLEVKLKKENLYLKTVPTFMDGMSEEGIIMLVMSIFMVIISIFIILIMFMTIRFTIIAALKNEEKEIGVMRALGVDSFGFRWLFAAKYIFFAFVGGIIGLVLGFPLSDIMLKIFSSNYISPEKYMLLIIGSIAVTVNILLMILFSLSVMRRIGKISVMDAIHGENHGERFKKSSVITLANRKKMSIPLFLSLSDILSRAKRYIFLIISYTLSIMILLIVFNLRNSVISPDFLKYMNVYNIDYFIDLSGESWDNMEKRCEAEGKSMFQIMEDDFKSNNIAAEVDYMYMSSGQININGAYKGLTVFTGGKNIDNFKYKKDSRPPRLDNEIALSWYTSNRRNIKTGDIVKVKLDEYSEDRTSSDLKEYEFVVTGFFDYMEGGGLVAVVGGKHDNINSYGENITAYTITAPASEKAEVFKQIEQFYGEEHILTAKEYLKKYMASFDRLFMLLEYIMGGSLLFVTVLITYLYQNIFITEETAEVALLKSMGFTDEDTKTWQFTRMLILALFSTVFAEVLYKTVGTKAVGFLFSIINLSGFGFLFEIPFTFIIIPVIFISAILITVLLKVKSVENVAVWNISEE